MDTDTQIQTTTATSQETRRLLRWYLYFSLVFAAFWAVFPIKGVYQMETDTYRLILFGLYYGLQMFLMVVFIAWLPVLFGFGLWEIGRHFRRLYRHVRS